ncbi:DDT domain-containing protein PTM [Punica granatum]|uniref:DDT domain-containing protein PTM n=2 Tax=Punica granatum TaxID=22663 RepID=A0A6P8E8P4_PUNGR|nr:DDT domain-containing protein PTM [Punica granatum]PKI57737.1 hypothetical protein CRG98_021804 [Punica granatum]
MDFIGRTVKKAFRGFGTFSGTVKSYDASSRFFKVVYEDGDSEELELSELVSLFQEPQRRKRMARARSGNVCGDSADGFSLRGADSDEYSGEGGGDAGFKGDLRGGINLNVAVEEAVELNLRDAAVCNGHVRGGFDLNSGLDLNEGFTLNDGVHLSPEAGGNSGKHSGIDLNLDATSDLDDNSRQDDVSERKECLFDLNLGIDSEMEDAEIGAGGQLGQATSLLSVDDNNEEVAVDVEVKFMDGYIAERTLNEVKSEVGDLTRVRKITSSGDLACEDSNLVPVEVLCGDIMDNGPTRVLDAIDDQMHSLPHSDGVREPSDAPKNVNQSDLGSAYRRTSGRRRKRKEMDRTPETVLRRSARRVSSKNQDVHTVKSAAFSDRTSCKSAAVSDRASLKSSAVSDRASSPAVSVITEEKPEDISATPPKLDLPPSSRTLDLDGISIFDVFSVYSCLRSFSTLLFLSPFDLEDFISAIRSESPNTLFDCIHVSLLQTLRKHLEHLSSEGSASALHCLRSLNWDLLDLITWPQFLVEYLLLHGSGMKLSELSSLKLLASDYCKQSASVKLDILNCLCDEVIEAEVIRSELSARTLGAEPDMEFDRSVSVKPTRKRRAAVGNSGRAYYPDELTDDTADWNSDECCLCKMDGSLICCDGCPAAYHSRCVAIVSDLLPEGDWYCPECVIERSKSQMKQRRPVRGAELLGSDPYNRLYFSCCGYLLVSDSCEAEVSYKFYHKNELTSVIEVLKSSEHYSDLLKAIYKQWDVSGGLGGAISDVDSVKCIAQKKILSKRDRPASSPVAVPNPLACGDICDAEDEKTLEKDSVVGVPTGLDAGRFARDPASGMETLYVRSEGSAVITATSGSQMRDGDLAPIPSAVKQDNISPIAPSDASLTLETVREDESEDQRGTGYMNYYGFGRVAASVVEELLENVKLNKDLLLSDEGTMSQQMRTISKNVDRFYWPNDKSVAAQKEKCGWCFSCRTFADDIECLFNTYMGTVYEGSESDLAILQSAGKKDSHFIGVACGMLSIEYRLRGLLLGPWVNSQYSNKWRISVLEASDLAALKSLLLKLASNLHQLAISEEWTKYEDSALVLGSASHVVTSSTSASSKPGPGRKRGRFSDPDSKPSSSASSGPGMFCWRGGRLSCRLFSWKVVPRSLVSKAAREGGSRKILGILYPENSDFARRSRYLAWQAAVESSTSISQLALQVREFDSNIKWDDIENTDCLCKMDKELRKSLRAFKKVIIRRKVLEADGAKYLLDFGKRRVIPEVVVRHGSVIKEGSSERKKYWLNEALLPLHILKSYEEKRIARVSNKSSLKASEAGDTKKKKHAKKMTSPNLLEAGVRRKKFSRETGFDYLFLRAERAEYSQCGHCKKDVPIREAVTCQFCKGFFHKWHAKKSGRAVAANCTYACYLCQQDNAVKNTTERTGEGHEEAGPFKGKVGKGNQKAKFITDRAKSQPQNYKRSLAKSRLVKLRGKRAKIGKKLGQSTKGKEVSEELPLRRSARQAAKYVAVQRKIRKGRKKGKPKKSKRGAPKRKKNEKSCQRKRTQACYSYWLNGLHLSRAADDKRVTNFRKKSIFSPYDHSTAARRDKVKCSLCGEGSRTSKSSYIACEICGGWYHGDAFGLDLEKMQRVMGFRCRVCRGKSPPVCPWQSHFPGVQNISIVELCVDVNGQEDDSSLRSKSNLEAEEGLPMSKKQRTSPSQG